MFEVDRTNGSLKSGYRLPTTPVFDGMAAAYGKLLVSLTDGSLVCLGETTSGNEAGLVPVAAKVIAEYNADSKVVPPSQRRGGRKGDRKRKVFQLGQGAELSSANAPYVVGRDVKITAQVRSERPDGVILAHGGNVLGYALYLKDGRLHLASVT